MDFKEPAEDKISELVRAITSAHPIESVGHCDRDIGVTLNNSGTSFAITFTEDNLGDPEDGLTYTATVRLLDAEQQKVTAGVSQSFESFEECQKYVLDNITSGCGSPDPDEDFDLTDKYVIAANERVLNSLFPQRY